jgi:hypothetical protein
MVLIRKAEPVEVLNLSLFDAHIVVDVRSREEYDVGRLASSLSCPALPPPHTDALAAHLMLKFAEMLAAAPPERYNVVVLVHGSGDLSAQFVHFLAARLQTALARSLQATPSAPSEAGNGQALEKESECGLPEQLYRSCEEIWLVEYEAFATAFPSLCRPVKWDAMHPTPRFIAPELYLSSRGSVYEEYWSDFGFTHFVTHAHPKVTSEFPVGLPCLCCDVPDRQDNDITSLMSAVAIYVCQAARVGGRVLLRVRGRTVSTACAAAYLCARGEPLTSALSTVAQAFRMKEIPLAQAVSQWAEHELPNVLTRLRQESSQSHLAALTAT